MKAISILLLLGGLASIVLGVLMRFMGLNILIANSELGYFVLANTLILLSLAVNSLRK
ncbi:MAG: hypothetical protein WBB86_05885 [Candidatus Omnitrophota bacterium]